MLAMLNSNDSHVFLKTRVGTESHGGDQQSPRSAEYSGFRSVRQILQGFVSEVKAEHFSLSPKVVSLDSLPICFLQDCHVDLSVILQSH